MGLSQIAVGEEIDLRGSTVVVCVPLYGAHDMFVRCFRSLLAHTPAAAPILIADDHGPDPSSERWVKSLEDEGLLDHRVIWMRNTVNLGFVGNCNHAMHAAGRADIVLVNSDVEVGEGWLEGLAAAAHSDGLVATATALTNDGTILSVPYRNRPHAGLPQHLTFDDAAHRIREESHLIRPEIPTAIGHCVYIRRTALDLVGPFDELFAPAYGEEADFSQRCIIRGLRHVAADDVFVLHHGRASLGVDGGRSPLQDAHEDILRARYPFYESAVELAEDDQVGPLARALSIASQALIGSRITIDGRCLGPSMTGTQVHTLELVAGLARTGMVHVRVVVPTDIGEHASAVLAANPGVEVLDVEVARNTDIACDDLVHRPYQINNAEDLHLLAKLGRRVVVTHQDLIAYRNPSYFPSAKDWKLHRTFTRESLALADRVLFFSEHAAADAIGEELVPKLRATVVHIGVDHHGDLQPAPPEPPSESADLSEKPFLLILGTDFRHKNRMFGLRVFEALRTEHGWDGRLVFAGPRVSNGSSAGDEAAYLAARPELAQHVRTFPAVSESAKNWLVEQAAAVLYPTTYEGFGLLPFEAAKAGTPCFFAHVTSMTELLGQATATIQPWDVDATAAACLPALTDPAVAQQMVDETNACAKDLTWDATASQLVAVYRETIADRGRDARNFIGDSMTINAKYWEFRSDIGPTGLSLIDPEDPLLPVASQRAVAALTNRSATRGIFLGLLSLVHRIATRGRALDTGPDGAAPDLNIDGVSKTLNRPKTTR